MTHDILQSDIELATRLMVDQRPDEEIIRALVHRAVEPDKAAQLVDDLRGGRKVTAHSPALLEFSLRRRTRSEHHASEREERPSTHTPAAESHRVSSARPAVHSRKNPSRFRWLFAILVGLTLVVVGIVLFQHSQARTNSPEEPGSAATVPRADHTPRQSPAQAATASQNGSPLPLVLELQADGLHVGGGLVTRGNVLSVVASLLGSPTRTNQVQRTGTKIYAYEHLGLLVYSQPGGGTNSIVLDCDATGGINGTTSPFAGLLKMEGRVIGPDLDAKALTAIKELGLKHPGTSDSIWNGRYHDVDLAFAYLKSTRRPSLIVIDLK